MAPKTQIDLAIRGKALLVPEVSGLLGIEATDGFEPSATYIGKEKQGSTIRSVERRRPSFGVWHYNTGSFVESADLNDHALFLISTFKPAEERIKDIINGSEFTVSMTIWHVGPNGFTLRSETIERLARLCESMSFTCWEVDEV